MILGRGAYFVPFGLPLFEVDSRKGPWRRTEEATAGKSGRRSLRLSASTTGEIYHLVLGRERLRGQYHHSSTVERPFHSLMYMCHLRKANMHLGSTTGCGDALASSNTYHIDHLTSQNCSVRDCDCCRVVGHQIERSVMFLRCTNSGMTMGSDWWRGKREPKEGEKSKAWKRV